MLGMDSYNKLGQADESSRVVKMTTMLRSDTIMASLSSREHNTGAFVESFLRDEVSSLLVHLFFC